MRYTVIFASLIIILTLAAGALVSALANAGARVFSGASFI